MLKLWFVGLVPELLQLLMLVGEKETVVLNGAESLIEEYQTGLVVATLDEGDVVVEKINESVHMYCSFLFSMTIIT